MSTSNRSNTIDYQKRVVVKFDDDVKLPYDESAADQLVKMGIGDWTQLSKKFKGITLGPLFSSRSPAEIERFVQRAVQDGTDYDPPNFLTYFVINIPEGIDPAKVVEALSKWKRVQFSYVEPPPVRPPVVNPADDFWSFYQTYLNPAPLGIDAKYAWGFSGGDGAGQAIIDVEWGWKLDHEDLVDHGIGLISGINHSEFRHGTAVLGVISAVDNRIGCVGITPNVASVRCVSQWRGIGVNDIKDAIMYAAPAMASGDVLLLEAHTNVLGYSEVPVEAEQPVFDAIECAIAAGIVVVEAAGNGGVDLDTMHDSAGVQIFNRSVRDSGAIVVGAGSSTFPHTRLSESCFGSRIDCYGWGNNAYSLATDNTGIAHQYAAFSGTSSASAIVAGACLAVQGLAEANLSKRFDPWELRDILSKPNIGTPSGNPSADRIGVMPDLRKIIDQELAISGP